MTSILKVDNNKNGIILKEIAKKFEEPTSTSGCDLEMSEITSSMPISLSLNQTVNCSENTIKSVVITTELDIVKENVNYLKINAEVSSDIEDVVDGFSILCFVTEEDLIKFSIKNEKIEALGESNNNKFKNISRVKKPNKFSKGNNESIYNEDGIDIYDFQGNSESSPSSKNSSTNFKKTLNKKFPSKYIKKFKHKFKIENALSPSEENSSITSVTEFHNNILSIDGCQESPRPTSNDDNNVVSTTTPDNVNISLEKLDLQSDTILSPLKTASLRLYKLEDELSISGKNVKGTIGSEKYSEDINDKQFSKKKSESNNTKVYNNQSSDLYEIDETEYPKVIPTKFSVDLLTKITDKQTIIKDSIKCLNNPTTSDWNNTKKFPGLESNSSAQNSFSSNKHKIFDTAAVTGDSYHINNKMTFAVVKHLNGNNRSSSEFFIDGSLSSGGSCNDTRELASNDNPSINDDECNNEKNICKSSADSPLQSWLESQNRGLIHHKPNILLNSTLQANSNATVMSTKCASGASFNPLNSSTHNLNLSHKFHSTFNHKTQHDSTLLDLKNNYFDNSKFLANSVQKSNQNFNSLSHELANNIRYQQEQHDLINALLLKHEKSKIPKPLVHMGFDSIFKADQKNPESKFQAPTVHNYFMPKSLLPADFNTANVFKTRLDPRLQQNFVEGVSNKESLISSNFKTPETLKKRGQWCDMHVKIAYFIYRSQRRMSMLKSHEINSQLSHLMYGQKITPSGPVPTASTYPSNFLQHSSSYSDFRPSQIKQDPGYLNYQPKSSNVFLNTPVRPMIPYHSMAPPNIDIDLLPQGNSYEDHHQSPEQKWLKLLSHYMTNHPLSSVDRPNPEMLNQLYMWYQQLAQSNNPITNFNTQTISPTQMQASNLDPNGLYMRKYMEHLSSCLGSIKGDSSSYSNGSLSDRDMQLYTMKQQQYQKALMSKYQMANSNKPSNMGHVNPVLINTPNPFYNKKIMEMKASNADCIPSLINQKCRLTQDQIRQIKPESLGHHQFRNGFSKFAEVINPKRRKLNSELLKTDVIQNGIEKNELKTIMDLTGDYYNITTVNNNNINVEKISTKSRDNINFHLQAVNPDNKE